MQFFINGRWSPALFWSCLEYTGYIWVWVKNDFWVSTCRYQIFKKNLRFSINSAYFPIKFKILVIFEAMVIKLIVAKNAVIETKNETEYSSAVCALSRKNAVDNMNNCAAEAKIKTFLKLIEQFESDRFGWMSRPRDLYSVRSNWNNPIAVGISSVELWTILTNSIHKTLGCHWYGHFLNRNFCFSNHIKSELEIFLSTKSMKTHKTN